MCLIIINNLMNYIINMNETMSLLMATSILALGGIGLYMYKTDEIKREDVSEYDEKGLFSSDLWGLNNNDEEYDEYNDEYNEKKDDDKNYDSNDEEYDLPKRKSRLNKTKKSKKSGGTKRRY